MPIRVCFPFVGDSVGGSHITSALLVRHLDRSLVEPIVVLHGDGPLAAYLRHAGIHFQIVPLRTFAGDRPPVFQIALAQARALPRLAPVLRRQNIDIVHTNDLRMHLTWAPASRAAHVKFLWHQRMLLSPARMWRWLGYAANHVICVSDAVRQTLPKGVPADVIFNPVDLSAATQGGNRRVALFQELGLDASAHLVGFVGNMTHQKRPDMFVRAAAHMAEGSAVPLAFLLFGDDRGGQRAGSERLAQDLGIGGNVHFLGHRTPIESWLAALDVLLAPGVGDGFGRTLIEAMAAQVPVVAVISGGHGEIISDGVTGLLVAADDPAALADAALRVIAEPDLAPSLRSAGRAQAIARFSASAYAQKVSAIYGQMMGRG